MIKIVSVLSFTDILELIQIAEQVEFVKLITAEEKSLLDELQKIVKQNGAPEIVVQIKEIEKDRIVVDIGEKNQINDALRSCDKKYQPEIFLSIILYHLFKGAEFTSYISTKATLDILNNIAVLVGQRTKTISGEPLNQLIHLWDNSNEYDIWYLFLDKIDGELRIFASAYKGHDSIVIKPSLFTNFILHYNEIENIYASFKIGTKLEKKDIIEKKQKKLLHSHPTHRVWYKKIQLWGGLSIRYYYHFQDHPELENKWLLKLHSDILRGKDKFVQIDFEYVDQMIKNYSKDRGQSPGTEYIVGAKIFSDKYNKCELINNYHDTEI